MGAEEPRSLSPRLGTACAFDKGMNELAVFSKRHKEILAGVRAARVGGAWQASTEGERGGRGSCLGGPWFFPSSLQL